MGISKLKHVFTTVSILIRSGFSTLQAMPRTVARISLVTATLLVGVAGSAHAALIELQWSTTVETSRGLHPGIAGEAVTTTIQVDNGGTTLLGQTWVTGDFIKYRVDGASGWWLESIGALSSGSSGVFSTDAGGSLISVGYWYDFSSWSSAITTSWSGADVGAWWNNGNNGIHGAAGGLDYLRVNNVSDNLVASNWTSSFVAVPEPSILALMGLGLAGLVFSRKRKRLK